jgi:hypothetical protein
MRANSTRPAVTIAQKVVRAIAAWVVDAPTCLVISSWAQLPFIEARLATRPPRYTRLVPNRRVRPPPSSAAAMAVTTWGRNIVPYWVLDRCIARGR